MIKKEKTIKRKEKSNISSIMMFLVIGAAFGAAIGCGSITYFENFMSEHVKSNNIFMELLKVYGLIVIFIIGYLIHIIIHEAGHLIFGLMTGYSFVSFRIGSFTLIKEDGKLKSKKFNIPGTAGQCLMMPPVLKDGKYPFVIYNFGGVIMNLIVSIASILVVVFVQAVAFPLDAILVLTSAGGIMAALTNGIPFKIDGVPNDAYNVLSIIKDEEARNGFYVQLKVYGLQAQGMRIKDMPLEMFKLSVGSDLCNPLNTAVRLMEYTYHLDNMDFDSAKQSIDSFIPHIDKLAQLFKREINCERMFIELVGRCDRDFIDDLYDKNLKKYIKLAKFMLGKKRLLMAYEGFYNDDNEKALKYYEEAKKLAKKCPSKGEADMELMLTEWIKKALSEV
ncbi:site-2 protease family protein [Clostridium sp.]|uniref:site-2 protease family protein n=1 Tax=Clostridium sp. TaxID=1506 RepID=UPI003D6CA75D